jgi:hypothetical protein
MKQKAGIFVEVKEETGIPATSWQAAGGANRQVN